MPETVNEPIRLRNHRECKTLTGLVYEYVALEPDLGKVRCHAKGSLIWGPYPGEHSVHFLKRGQVVILLSDREGDEVIVRVVRPGEIFGELCFCLEQTKPRENSAQAVVDSECLEVQYPDFLAFLRREPRALETLTFTLCQRLTEAEVRIEILSHRGAEKRLGRLLLHLANGREAATGSHAPRIPLAIGHDDLSRMAAMTRPHVSVTMGKLRSLGLIDYQRGSPLLVDVGRLRAYLEKVP